MSPATVPAYPQTYTAIDFAIQLSIIGGSGVIIIIVVWYLSRREEDSYRKAEISSRIYNHSEGVSKDQCC